MRWEYEIAPMARSRVGTDAPALAFSVRYAQTRAGPAGIWSTARSAHQRSHCRQPVAVDPGGRGGESGGDGLGDPERVVDGEAVR